MILIPMMGKSSRFLEAGYNQPKFMLPIRHSNLFKESVLSFKDYFQSDFFIFTIPDNFFIEDWIKNQLHELKLKNFSIIKLDADTNGQADTIYQTLSRTDIDGELNIFNIDTILKNFKLDKLEDNYDGYLEVFKGQGDHWSFAEIDSDGKVLATSEKKRISPYCSNGFYNFKNKEIFIEGFLKQQEFNNINNTGEIYIAPIYNFLIEMGFLFKVKEVDIKDIIFSGVPSEYELMLKDNNFLV